LKKPLLLAKRMAYSDIGEAWCRIKDSSGKAYTVQNFGYIFTWGQYFVTDTDSERITHTRYDAPLQTLTILKIFGNPKTVSYRLSNLTQPILDSKKKAIFKKFWKNYSDDIRTQCKITESEVKETIIKALDSGSCRREGRRLVSLFWVVDSFLDRKPITIKPIKSRWVTLPNANIRDYLKESSETLMKKHIKFQEPFLAEVKEEMKTEIEKSLLEKLKDRIKR